MEQAAQERIDAGDGALVLVGGADVITAADLADGIHPNDAGHARLADVFGSAVATAAAAGAAAAAGRDT
jgi:lysophospholipase L1-like esterase